RVQIHLEIQNVGACDVRLLLVCSLDDFRQRFGRRLDVGRVLGAYALRRVGPRYLGIALYRLRVRRTRWGRSGSRLAITDESLSPFNSLDVLAYRSVTETGELFDIADGTSSSPKALDGLNIFWSELVPLAPFWNHCGLVRTLPSDRPSVRSPSELAIVFPNTPFQLDHFLFSSLGLRTHLSASYLPVRAADSSLSNTFCFNNQLLRYS